MDTVSSTIIGDNAVNNDDQTTFEGWGAKHDSLYEAICEAVKSHHSDGMQLSEIANVLDVIQCSVSHVQGCLHNS